MLGCGPHESCIAPVRIPISFWSRAAQSEGGGRFSVEQAFLLFLVGELMPHCSALLHNMQIPGKVSLDLVNARSKLSGPWYLTVLPYPGSIRAKA